MLTVRSACAHKSVNTVNFASLGQPASYLASVSPFKTRHFWYSGALNESAPSEMVTHPGRADRAVGPPVVAPGACPTPPERGKGPVSVLAWKQQRDVLAALVDGNSERAVERMTEVSRPTIGKLALRLGQAAQWLHNRIARDLSCSLIEDDEIWSYVGKKEARVKPGDPDWMGEAYTWTALDKTSRFVITWHVGKRDEQGAEAFIADLRARLVVMPSLMATDGLSTYEVPMAKHFGPALPYGQVVKNYRTGAKRGPDHRYEPPRDPFITKRVVSGAPDMKKASTSYIERNNGTMRHFIGRMRRLCYAFSKHPEHHKAAVALGYVHYNMCHMVRTLRVTPAMAVGVVSSPWSLEELLDALLSAEPCDPPHVQPLVHPKPAETARELPNGRGFMRALQGGKAPAPAPMPEAPTPAPVVAAPAPASMAPTDDRQLDLLSWKPKPRKSGQQLSLFGEDE
jgi:IS1 family transposase